MFRLRPSTFQVMAVKVENVLEGDDDTIPATASTEVVELSEVDSLNDSQG